MLQKYDLDFYRSNNIFVGCIKSYILDSSFYCFADKAAYFLLVSAFCCRIPGITVSLAVDKHATHVKERSLFRTSRIVCMTTVQPIAVTIVGNLKAVNFTVSKLS